jgi:hypothetical protein
LSSPPPHAANIVPAAKIIDIAKPNLRFFKAIDPLYFCLI